MPPRPTPFPTLQWLGWGALEPEAHVLEQINEELKPYHISIARQAYFDGTMLHLYYHHAGGTVIDTMGAVLPKELANWLVNHSRMDSDDHLQSILDHLKQRRRGQRLP